MNKRITFCLLLLYIINCIGFSKADDFDSLKSIRSETTPQIQTEAAQDVVKRIFPEKWHLFNLSVDVNLVDNDKDSFTILNNNGTIEINASSGVAAVWGFHYYIKNYCNCHIGWQIKQLSLPDQLPQVNITINAKDRLRYYQNVCTTSYSFAWWNKEDWRQHIDWMALNGINIALASHGQEAIWDRIFRKLNLTQQEIDDHFAGPAFLSWQRMGNIRGWGGPLSDNWHLHSLRLQHFIVKAMRDLGMTPVLPAFAGHVPKAFKRIFPTADVVEVEPWNKFKPEYCCTLFLQPTDPLFVFIGRLFLSEMIEEFGASHVYNSDPFNENKPTSEEVDFLKSVGSAIHESMTSIDPKAIWMLQSWMFVHEVFYWIAERVEALLTSVKMGRILVLDLQSEQWPQYDRFEMYYGQPFIWCMLHNFGGTLGLFGDSQSINTEVYRTRSAPNSTMVGIGLTPEGINQNNVMYDLMLESALRESPVDIDEWSYNYTIRRYGTSDESVRLAWNYLMKSVYNFTGLEKIRGKYIISRRPNLDLKPWSWYSSSDLLEAWRHLLDAHPALGSAAGYRHDLADLTRQVLQYKADQVYSLIMTAFYNRDLKDLDKYSEIFMSIFEDLQEILSSNRDFLLGNWLNASKSLAVDDKDRDQFEYNARNQITLWGPNGEIIDYANKQWAGMIEDFFAPRWRKFLAAMRYSVKNNSKFNKNAVQNIVFTTVERPFTFSRKIYPTSEIGDTVEIAQRIFSKWYRSDSYADVPIRFILKNVKRTESSYKQLLHRQMRDIEENSFKNEIIFDNKVYQLTLV